jgi:hypothetical protein
MGFTQAQLIKTTVHFHCENDSFEIGKPVLVSLVVKHPSSVEVLFPDTNANFSIFACIGKEWFPTRTIGVQSTDSATYTLQTFFPQTLALLSLPVYIVSESDSLALQSNTDSMFFKSLLAPKLVGLKEDIDYQYVKDQLDYPRLLLIFILLAVTAGIGYGIFGRRITQYIRQLLLYRRQRIFLNIFDKLAEQSVSAVNPALVEEILSLWKRHLQRLSGINYSTFTTRDFSKVFNNDNLISILRRIDKVVYAGDTGEIKADLFITLREQAQDFYLKRREALRYGSV